MQYFDEVAAALSVGGGGASEFAALLRAVLDAQDDLAETRTSEGQVEIRQQSWKLMDDVVDCHPSCVRVLEGLFAGLAAGCGRYIPLTMRSAAGGKPPFVWLVG